MTAEESSFEKARRKMVAARIEFMSQLAKFSHAELSFQPDADTWTPLQLAHHIYIADGLALEQMKHIQDEENPAVEDLAELTPHLTNTAEAPASLEAVLAGMAARRETIFQYLSDLPADAWERPFQHPSWGQIKFYQLVNILPMHDKQHAQQLETLKAQLEAQA